MSGTDIGPTILCTSCHGKIHGAMSHVSGELLCSTCFAQRFPPVPTLSLSSWDEVHIREIIRDEIARARKG